MKTWNQFIENHEKDEEKNGLDLDHDNEKGESKEHKEKIKQAKKEMIDFFETRKESARKTANEARQKGGPSLLTSWHFFAKIEPYQEIISAIKSNRDESFFLSKCKSALSKIHCGKMTQKSFQEHMGILEVYGEALAKLFK